MEGRDVALLEIPGLGRKLHLIAEALGENGAAKLAKRFDRSQKTLHYWSSGNAFRPASCLPSEHLPVLKAVVAEVTGLKTTSQAVDDLVFGPPVALEHLLSGRRGVALRDVIERFGAPGRATLLAGADAITGIVQIDRHVAASNSLSVPLDEPFRLIFHETPRCAQIVVLQNSPSAWAYLGSGHRLASGDLLVPGRRADGGHAVMTESSEPGAHRFVVIGLSSHLEFRLDRYAADGLPLDLPALSALAGAIRSNTDERRHIRFCEIIITRTPR